LRDIKEVLKQLDFVHKRLMNKVKGPSDELSMQRQWLELQKEYGKLLLEKTKQQTNEIIQNSGGSDKQTDSEGV